MTGKQKSMDVEELYNLDLKVNRGKILTSSDGELLTQALRKYSVDRSITLIESKVMTLKADITPFNMFCLHLDLKAKWSPDVYKAMMLEFQEVLDFLAGVGVTQVYIMVPKELVKFETMFGFVALLRVEADNKEYILMNRGTR